MKNHCRHCNRVVDTLRLDDTEFGVLETLICGHQFLFGSAPSKKDSWWNRFWMWIL